MHSFFKRFHIVWFIRSANVRIITANVNFSMLIQTDSLQKFAALAKALAVLMLTLVPLINQAQN